MRKFTLPLIVLAALALVSVAADSAQAVVRHVYLTGHGVRVRVAQPIRPIYRSRVVIAEPVVPLIYDPWNYNSTVILRHGNHLHIVPAGRPIGTLTPIVW